MSSPCERAYVDGSDVVVPCSDVVQAGNVLLMVTAAPELLAALEAMVSLRAYTDSEEEYQRARAVIRKARGAA